MNKAPTFAESTSSAAPSLEDVRQAHACVASAITRTPTLRSATLSEICGCEVWLKFENQQFTASFKERGALNKLLSLNEAERSRGVVAASAGNHAQAVAYHARRLGIAATIVMPETTPFSKVSNTLLLGAEIEQVGETVDDARRRAAELVSERNLVLIPPFDDPRVIAGQGTIALEMLEDAPAMDAVVVPVGGGGLISGIALTLKALSPETRIVGVQAARFCAMAQRFEQSRAASGSSEAPRPLVHPVLGPFGADTLADGIAVKTPGELTGPIILRHVDEMLLISEASIERACNDLLELEKTVAEGAGAAGLAAVLQYPERFSGQRVACVISGGNIDPRVMADTIYRGLARTGRLARLRVDVKDLPGSLAQITRLIADAGANIVEVLHERVFLASPDQRTRLSIEIATRGRSHVEEVVALLRARGHGVEVE
jgi:threonine dehydratase